MAAGDKVSIFEDLMRFKPDGMTANAWAVTAGVSRTVWADMRRHGNPSRRTLEKLLIAAGSSLAEFEALRIDGATSDEGPPDSAFSDRRTPAWGGAQLPGLPLAAAENLGTWGDPAKRIELFAISAGELVGRVPRPLTLARDSSAYAVTIVGDSMWPRFRPGRVVAVSAHAPVTAGDDVVVKLKTEMTGGMLAALIKEMVGQDESRIELRQFNPDITFAVPREDIVSIERVLGELI